MADFDAPDANDWLAVNQFTVVENKHERRPDIVLFVNGLPLGVIELKNPTDENATIRSAFQQLQTYEPLAKPVIGRIFFPKRQGEHGQRTGRCVRAAAEPQTRRFRGPPGRL